MKKTTQIQTLIKKKKSTSQSQSYPQSRSHNTVKPVDLEEDCYVYPRWCPRCKQFRFPITPNGDLMQCLACASMTHRIRIPDALLPLRVYEELQKGRRYRAGELSDELLAIVGERNLVWYVRREYKEKVQVKVKEKEHKENEGE